MKLNGKFDVGGIIAKEDERYKVVDNSSLNNLVLSSTSLNPGHSTSGHKHAGQDQLLSISRGHRVRVAPGGHWLSRLFLF